MAEYRSIPTSWNRTFSALGIGGSFFLFFGWHFGDKLALAIVEHLGGAIVLSEFAINLLIVFAAYVMGELLISVGSGLPVGRPHRSALYAMFLFCKEDASGFWFEKLRLAELRNELFRCLGTSTAIGSVILALDYCLLEQVWPSAIGTLALGLFLAWIFSYEALKAFSELENTLAEIAEPNK
ncbi:hypothetical protein [Puniceibacterium sediminis]|uniref:Uncharacterized protein n=1 Tax=Puniceibacterium sediminis TaxID=1608407 RepID=A0A238WJX5_9RHOB|nr:hypothetical protein [Puniceibacterium sediminis]SNR46865.1 hypothetical protein SAMN06265370_10683 [Puniceibacterium sediminis]